MKGEMFLYINVSYNIKNIVYIDEDKKFMRIIYNLQKNWFDTLLTFQNLNKHRVNTIFPRSLSTAIVNCLLFPVLPLCGIIFAVVYFTLGLYVYNHPNIDYLGLCNNRS